MAGKNPLSGAMASPVKNNPITPGQYHSIPMASPVQKNPLSGANQSPVKPVQAQTQQPHQTVTFNPDSTVTVQHTGQPAVTVDRATYNSFLQTQGGGPQNGVKGGSSKLVDQLRAQLASVQDSILNPQASNAQINQDLAQIKNGSGNVTAPGQSAGDNALQYGQAAGAGLLSGIGAGVAAGASVGTAVAPIVGTAVGVIVGAGAAATKLAIDERQQTKEAFTNYKNAKKGLVYAQNLANMGRRNEALQVWTTNQRNMLIAQAQLKQKTNTAIGRQLSGAMDEYSTVNDYLDNYLSSEQINFAYALNNPNPNKVQALPEDILNG